MPDTLEVRPHPQGALVNVKARAGGSRNGVTGVELGHLKVSVTQIAEGGKANRAIAAVLAEYFKCAKSRVQIVSGGKSSKKTFLLVDSTCAEIEAAHLARSKA